MITNYQDWASNLDERIRSRLIPDMLSFDQYNEEETRGILKQRREYAFVQNVWDEDAFELIVKKTAAMKDIRMGLFMMREAGLAAEPAMRW